MKIKTIRARLDNAATFDKEVNQAMAEGYQLARQDVIPGFRLDGGNFLHNMLFAQLVLPDPEPVPEAQPLDPFDALRSVQEFCDAVPVADCCTDRCPLYIWCDQLRSGGDPTDWLLPEKEAPEA